MPQAVRDPWLDALDAAQRQSDADPWLATLDQVQQPDARSIVAKAYDVAFTAPAAVTRGAAAIANRIDTPRTVTGGDYLGAVRDVARNLVNEPVATIRGGVAGMVEGAASLLTPGDAVLTAIGFGPVARAIRGVRGGTQAIQGAQRLASGAMVARGAERALDADSLPEAAAGAAQAALGGIGLTASPPKAAVPAPAPKKALPAGPRFVATPDGRVAPAGTDVPMVQAEDGSFVRGVPAEYARREVRGLLPAGPRFVASPGAVAHAADEDAFVAALDAVQRAQPDGSGVRSVQPAVIERDGPQVRQYSSDVDARVRDDVHTFARMFDDIDPAPSGAPGEGGFIAPDLAARAGGAVAGGLTGAASADEDESPWRTGARVAVGAALGSAAPSLLRRGQAPTRVVQPRATVIPMPESGAAAPRVGRSGDPLRDPLAGLDPFLGKFTNPLVQAGVRERLIEHNGFADQRRGTINTRQLGQFASQVRVDLERALPKGTALSGEGVAAYARAVQETQKRVATLADLVNSGKATDADLVAFEAAKADADVVLKSLMGARTEAGRALQQFRALNALLETGRVDLIRSAAAQLREDAQRFAGEFAKQPDSPIVRYRWLQQHGTASTWDRVRSYYYANILSGVKTHERNILGNVFSGLGNLASQPFAAGADAIRSAVTGAPRQVTLGELPHQVVGAFTGVERGFADALFTMRHGVSPTALDTSLKAAEVGKLDLPRVEFSGGAGNPFNWPGRLLDSVDVFFRSVARHAELSGNAYTIATNEGRTGDALIDRMAELASGATPEGAALREAAEHVAARAVFQEKGGPITSWLAQGYRVPVLGQAMTFVMPFLRTPGNIIRQGLEASPAGFGMAAARQGGRAGAQAQGKAAMGSMAAGYLAWLAATGRLSGDGPQDPAERSALMESGWRPNSVKLGDQWVSYQLMQPLSVQAALVANAYEAWRSQSDGSEKSASDIAAETFARGANSFLEQSFLQGAFDLVEALKDPERSATRLVGRTAYGLVPFSSAVRSVQSALDPVVRQPRGIVEQVQSATPGLSEQVPARIGRFGQEITREGGPLRRAADPFNASTDTQDPVSQELARLQFTLTVPAGRLTVEGQSLTRDESQVLKQRQGQAVRAALDRLLASAGYQRLDDTARFGAIRRLVSRTRAEVNAAYRREMQRARRRGRVDRSVAGGKFMGALPGPITRAELQALIPEMSQAAGRQVTYDELKAEAESRGLVVQEP